jgi:hypothetical protein
MTHTNPIAGRSTAQHLKAERDQLKREQLEALQRARFGGMTAEETKSYDERHRRIKEIMRQLALMEEARASRS